MCVLVRPGPASGVCLDHLAAVLVCVSPVLVLVVLPCRDIPTIRTAKTIAHHPPTPRHPIEGPHPPLLVHFPVFFGFFTHPYVLPCGYRCACFRAFLDARLTYAQV